MPATNDLLLRLIKDINDVRSALRRTTANLPLYDIDNENSPAQITSDQNNYVPGNYDVLRLTSDANRNITGITSGVKGRKLRIFNVGSYAITLVNQSGLSLAANRFNFVNASDFIIPPDGNALLYYDATDANWIGGDAASIYDVVNETTPAQFTANQNNYDPGVYEVLRLSSDASRTITGISGGVKGRSLQIFNVGNFNITLAYESGSSIAANRFYSPSAENTVLYPRAGVRLYYDSTLARWMIPDAPTWEGPYGMSLAVRNSVALSIPTGLPYTKLSFDTIDSDEWGMWNAANSKIIIPFTGTYMGVISSYYDKNATGMRQLRWYDEIGANYLNGQNFLTSDANNYSEFSCPIFKKFSAGDEIALYTWQNSGGNLNLFLPVLSFTRIK